MADWNNPQNASLYTDVMQMIKDRDAASLTMLGGALPSKSPIRRASRSCCSTPPATAFRAR